MTWTGADLVLDVLASVGVRRLFGVPGGPLLSLLERLDAHPGLEFVLTKHEEGAVFMAEGFAQAGGGLGVACVTAGPGTMHALTAAASATSDGAPVLLLAGQVAVPSFGRGALQDSSGGDWGVDLVAMMRTATKLSALVADPRQLEFLLHRAIWAATSPVAGASHLALPADVLTAPAPRPLGAVPRPLPPVPADADDVGAVAAALADARRPVVLAGQGAKLAQAGPALVRLAERLDLPVATTMKGKSVFPEDHPLALGVFGTYGSRAETHERVLADDVDMLLVLGSSLGEVSTAGWDERLTKNRTVWQVDADVRQLGRGMPVDRVVHADARAFVDELLEALPAHRAASESARTGDAGAGRPSGGAVTAVMPGPLLRGSEVADVLDRRLSSDTLLLVDNGNALCWIGERYRSGGTREVLCSLNVGCMGYSVPAAVGVRLARPDRPVVAVVGDAAFAMICGEVHTAVEARQPVVWVVLNNAGNAMVANLQELLFSNVTGSMYGSPIDAAAVARGLGARAFAVHDRDELERALDEALDAAVDGTVPYLLDVHVDPDEVGWSLQARADMLRSEP